MLFILLDKLLEKLLKIKKEIEVKVESFANIVEHIKEELLEIYVNFVILRNGEIMIILEFGENDLHRTFIVFFLFD